MYPEEELLPLSALQHLLYCERQCALIHVEQQWVENRYTAEGRIMHERVHTADRQSRGTVRTEFAVALRSLALGIVGQADVVEFHKTAAADASHFNWQPFPVEYKRGRPKTADWDQVQLCAQAICLEEMLATRIDNGALFYGKTRRRIAVRFDGGLRQKTIDTARRLHRLVASGRTPAPVYSGKCNRCSFIGRCLPKILDSGKSAGRYLAKLLED